jgi:hypothetical protein
MTKIKHAFNAADDRLKLVRRLLEDRNHEAARDEIAAMIGDVSMLFNANMEKIKQPALEHG